MLKILPHFLKFPSVTCYISDCIQFIKFKLRVHYEPWHLMRCFHEKFVSEQQCKTQNDWLKRVDFFYVRNWLWKLGIQKREKKKKYICMCDDDYLYRRCKFWKVNTNASCCVSSQQILCPWNLAKIDLRITNVFPNDGTLVLVSSAFWRGVTILTIM